MWLNPQGLWSPLLKKSLMENFIFWHCFLLIIYNEELKIRIYSFTTYCMSTHNSLRYHFKKTMTEIALLDRQPWWRNARSKYSTVHFHQILPVTQVILHGFLFSSCFTQQKSENFKKTFLVIGFSENWSQIFTPCKIAKFHLISRSGNFVEKRSFLRVSPETLWKLCLSAKYLHQEIRWNFGILHSVASIFQLISEIIRFWLILSLNKNWQTIYAVTFTFILKNTMA